MTDFAVGLRTKSQFKLLLNWHLKRTHFISTFLHQKFSKFYTPWKHVTFFTSSFKWSKSTPKYYNSLELESFFLLHCVPPSALTVSELRFLTAYDIEEVSLPRDSSMQVSGYADMALFYAWHHSPTGIVQRRPRQKFRQWLMLVWGPQGCVNIQIALKQISLWNQSGVLIPAGL